MAGNRTSKSRSKNTGQKRKSVPSSGQKPGSQIVSAPNPIELFVSHNEDGQFEATVGIRWAISPQTLQHLVDNGVKDPYLLIVVMNNSIEVDRYIFPLKKEMDYLSFRRPGVNIICSTIVWKKQEDKLVKDIILGKDNGNWKTSVINWSCGTAYSIAKNISQYINRLDYEARANVDVPSEMFAPEPPKIIKTLGNFHNLDTARNECQLRDRALFTAISFPLYVVWWVVRKMVVIVSIIALSVWGCRNIDYDPLFSIRYFEIKNVWSNIQPSRWWFEEDGKDGKYEIRGMAYLFINPPIFLVALAVGWFMWFVSGGSMPRFWYTFFCVVLIPPVFMFLVWVSVGFDSMKKESSKIKAARELEALVCKTPDGVKADISALPRNHRTIRLHYLDLKRKVCRPYAR